MKRRLVLVTGGFGFIGSTIVDHLAAQGDHVVIIDDHSSPVTTPADLPNHVTHLNVTVRSFCGAAWTRAPRNRGYDQIIHCASPVGPAGILRYKGRIASMILADTAALIEYAQRTDTPLVNISTSEVYGTSGVYHEDDDLRVPAVPSARIEYAIGKMAAEAECRLTAGLRSISIRPFNVAGPRQSSAGGFVIPTFAQQALGGNPLTIYGDGSQRRAFTSVDDLARFVTGLQPEHYDGRCVNIGNPANETSIRNLARMFDAPIEYTSGKAVHGDDYEEAEGHVKTPDIRVARGMGWEPRVLLAELVEQALDYYQRLAPAA